MELKNYDPSVHPGVKIKVEAFRRPYALEIHYEVVGPLGEILFPEPVDAPVRKDELWKTTCFECFLAPDGGEAYLEFNFSPSGNWQAYRLKEYRGELVPFDQVQSVEIRTSSLRDRFLMTAVVHLFDECLGKPCDGNASVNVILEDGGKRQSYWAPEHPKEKFDFHDRSGFLVKV